MASARHRPRFPDLGEVLRDLYGALSEEATFSRCMDVLGVPLRSHLSGVHHEDLAARFSRVDISGRMPAEEMLALSMEYAARWAGQNEWLHRGMEQILKHGYGDSDEAVTEAELFAMPYYQHYLKRVDVRHGIGVCIWRGGPGQLTVASFNRSPAEGPFGKDAMRFIAALRPHLYNAYAIYRRTALLSDTTRSLRATLDHAPIGTLVIDASCRILEANAEAEIRLADHHGLSRSHGDKLVVAHFGQHKKLEAAVAELVSGAACNKTILVVKPGRSASEGIALQMCALPDPGRQAMSSRVIIFLCPLTGDCADRVAALILQSALSLTPAEARVVLALHSAHDIAGAAAALGVGVSTARTHLKHAFDKTGARKQSELLSIVERLLIVTPHGAANDSSGKAVLPST